ncbi:MAG: hypothetical protein DMF61_04975 [Blastocatellia bacterium AA13]|nr:MAG: hypothetical protein DMF61_04975 [Blastocatellia bacterium AA13]
MIEILESSPLNVNVFRRRALIVGLIALAVCGIGALINPGQFFRSYLLAYVFWIGISLGCLAILMVQHMSGGVWGLVSRRVLEAAAATFPLLAILFLPVAFGIRSIFVWAQPAASLASNEELAHAVQQKQLYLNVPFFLARAAFYFAVWIAVASTLNRWSRRQDRTGDRMLTSKLQGLSGPGLLLYGLTVTFSSIDWVMSLDPRWFSTIYGMLFMGGQGLSAMAFVIAVLAILSGDKPMSEVVRPAQFHDLGKLMLAFLMLWAYFAFSQYLIIWAGNLPEEIPWYTRRIQSSWKWVGLGLIVLHFMLPFVLLLSRELKRNRRSLTLLAGIVILMRFVDLMWMTGPEFHGGSFGVHWMDIVMPVGIGGIWLAFFATRLAERPLLPIRDPYIEDALTQAAD